MKWRKIKNKFGAKKKRWKKQDSIWSRGSSKSNWNDQKQQKEHKRSIKKGAKRKSGRKNSKQTFYESRDWLQEAIRGNAFLFLLEYCVT